MNEATYYTINPSTDLESVGIYNQLDVPDNYHEIAGNFEILDYSSFPAMVPNMENFKVNSSAIMTDILSAYRPAKSIGLFVSQKFKELLEKESYVGVKFYESSIIHTDGSILNSYYFMHVIDNYDIIDYDKSTFVDFSEDDKKVILTGNDKYDLPDFVEAESIALKEKPDLFRSPYNIEILISEEFKSILEKNDISGVSYEVYSNNSFLY